MKLQILLSTYNGERYLREQLDSFLKLSGVELSVLVRDDGSTDSTADILREYSERYGFKVIFGENIGVNKSVFELARARDTDCELYAFADQDDVWLENKAERAVSMLGEYSSPALYAGSSYLTDRELNIIGRTKLNRKPLSFYNAMVENVCIGHTLFLNKPLMDIYADSFSEGIFMFDYWAYLIASAFGKIFYDEEPTTLYRQHTDNAIGYKNSFFGRLKNRVARVLTGKSYYNARQLSAFLSLFGKTVPDEFSKEGERFFGCQKSFFSRLGYIFRTKAYRQGFGEGFIFRMMYLFGRYNI